MHFISGLRPLSVHLLGGGADPVGPSTTLPLQVGRVYELRCSGRVHVKAGDSGDASTKDIAVEPTAPLVFRADVEGMRICATTTDAFAWLREGERNSHDELSARRHACD